MNKKVLLLVDDSLTARKLITGYLSNFLIKVMEAGDGRQGLNILREHPEVGLIISDINMPGMNGIEMVAEIKKVAEWSHIPICMLTTESGTDALNNARQLGTNSFLVKPVQKDQLLTVINGYL